ncbi:hypothetical protein ACFL60_00765 [Candidatus Omnitrophota bacterium]
MSEFKTYRVTGWFFVIFGVVASMLSICQPHKFQRLISDPGAELIPAIYGSLMLFATNVFIWIGLVLQAKADKIESPDKRSKWGKCIKIYAIFAAIMIILTIFFLFMARK